MPYVYPDVDVLNEHDLVGNHQCVVLVQTYTNAPRAANWRQGASVRGHLLLAKGTAIATFVDAMYKNHSHGNHAAFYLSQDQGGILVMDQWRSATKFKVSRHYLPFKGADKHGKWVDSSNNGDAFSVIE